MYGQMLGGRYQIIKHIGQGGFGVTFLAVDMQRVRNPQCIVKQLKPRASDPYTLREAKRLFDQEAQTLEELGNHDQIPRWLAHFEENKEFYLVQEYIEGHDLNQEVLPGKQLSEAVVIKLLQDILEVLAFVHQQGVIHRDIKPSNIRRRKSDGKIILIDFGAVKEITTQVVNSQGQTTHTIPIGTPGYMPSEQAKGHPKLSSDVYAVGILCIQALTGIDPDPRYGGGLPMHPHTGEIIWRDRTQISPKLANILDKMVLYDYRQRYQSAVEALEAVRERSPKSPPGKVFIGVGVAALASLILLFYLLKRNPTPNFSLYENPNYGIKIKYAEDWTKQKQGDFFGEVVKFFPSNKNQSNSCQLDMVIQVDDLPQGLLSLEEYKNLALKKIKNNNPNTQITDESNTATTLANFSAYKLIYTRLNGQCNLKVMEIGTVRNSKAYYITYTADATQFYQFLPVAEEMIKSFEINAPTPGKF